MTQTPVNPTRKQYREFFEYLENNPGRTSDLGAARGIIAEMEMEQPAPRNRALEYDLADSTFGPNAEQDGLIYGIAGFCAVFFGRVGLVIHFASQIGSWLLSLGRLL